MAHRFPDAATLGEARAWLRLHVDKGERCPCCTQFAKVYRRKINAGMARALIRMCRLGATEDYIHTATAIVCHEVAQLSWWGLISEEPIERPDGGRAGWWKVTPLGERWAHNRARVAKFVHIYDSRVLGLDDTEQWSVVDALGKRFDLEELWRGE